MECLPVCQSAMTSEVPAQFLLQSSSSNAMYRPTTSSSTAANCLRQPAPLYQPSTVPPYPSPGSVSNGSMMGANASHMNQVPQVQYILEVGFWPVLPLMATG